MELLHPGFYGTFFQVVSAQAISRQYVMRKIAATLTID
jgi:hypothetical protein